MYLVNKIMLFINYKSIWQLLSECFPKCYLRTYNGQFDIVKLKEYHVKTLTKKTTLIGMLAWWDFDWCYFLEYLCVKKQFRGTKRGHGLLKRILEKNKLVILEIDKNNYSLIDFYSDHGFILNDYCYEPMCLSSDNPNNNELMLMSYPRRINTNEYSRFIQELNKPKYNQYRK